MESHSNAIKNNFNPSPEGAYFSSINLSQSQFKSEERGINF